MTAVVAASSEQLTLWGAVRPPPPLDPFVYDAGAEKREYCRSLLPAAELSLIEEEIKRSGFMTIEQIRELVASNSVKENMDARGETYAIDPELMILIDARVNFPIFINSE